ncbi:GNAT family N-acetyltransferase [Actinomadura fibrosa]|uniref:GNAT family N-acetyltransferase n=1 Tax=Actinomadura fibrosa TaxID=111802 RepID=A0ABW2XPR3_9ACTN
MRRVLAGLGEPGRTIELRRIVVSAQYRGVGLGRSLPRAGVGRCYRRHGARRVWLDVRTRNLKARTLYRSEGFQPVTREFVTDNATVAGGEPDPDLIVMLHSKHVS